MFVAACSIVRRSLAPFHHCVSFEAEWEVPNAEAGIRQPRWRRGPRFDVPVLAVGAVASAVLSVGLATALLLVSRSNASADVGPTAATLEEALSTLFGAALGLLVGSGLTASLARRGSRVVTGIVAGSITYLAVLVPILVLTRPSDVGAGESLGLAFVIALPLGLVVVVGAVVGSGIAIGFGAMLGRRDRSPTPPPSS
jgi:hypothetical protein